MIAYVKLKTENKELYNENFLEKLKNKNTKFSKLQYNICYFFYKFIVFIKYLGNIITVKKIFYSYIFILPFSNKKVSKYKIRKSIKKLKKLMQKYNVNTLALSNELKKIVKIEDYKPSINFLEENSIMPYLIQEILSYVLEANKARAELEDLYICIKQQSPFYIENIYYLSNYLKTINIITPNIKNFQKVANKLEESGMLITVTNNKEKSLKRAKLIVNIDFTEEELETYIIYRNAIIISMKQEKAYKNVGFDGLQIKQIEIDASKEIKNTFKKYNLLENYSLSVLYNSVLSGIKGFENAKLKIEKDEVKIVKLYGNNGEISKNEYLRIANY